VDKEPNVLSVIMESKINGKVAFVYLNSQGTVIDTLILTCFSMRNTKYTTKPKQLLFE